MYSKISLVIPFSRTTMFQKVIGLTQDSRIRGVLDQSSLKSSFFNLFLSDP